MTDPKFHLRSGEAGSLVKGTPGNVLTFQSDGTVRGETPASGGTVVPVQNERYLDAASVATPNGSIASPWVDPQDFLDEVVGGGAGLAWKLKLSGTANPDFTVPDLPSGVVVVFEGLAEAASVLGSIPVASQSNDITLVFQDVHVSTLSFSGVSGLVCVFVNSSLTQSDFDGSVEGSFHFTNCTVGFSFGHPDAAATFVDCNLKHVSADVLTCDGCTFAAASDIAFATSARLTSTTFGAGCHIRVTANQPLTLDQATYANMVSSGVTFPDTTPALTLEPSWSPVFKFLQGLTFNAAPGVTEHTIEVTPANPSAQHNDIAMAQFFGTSSLAGVIPLGAHTDGSGAVVVALLNPTLASIPVVDPAWVVMYLPRVDP